MLQASSCPRVFPASSSGDSCRFTQLGRGVKHGLDDVLVAGAAAQIARHADPNLGLGRVRVVLQKSIGAHQHAWRAEAALQAVLREEAFLYRVQNSPVRQALHCHHLGAVALHCEMGTTLDRLCIHVDRTCTAVTRFAADVCSGQIELFAQKENQQHARLDGLFDGPPIDLHADQRLRHSSLQGRVQWQRLAATASARRTICPAIAVLYSRLPRRSSAGSQIAIAFDAASSIAAGVRGLPVRACSAATARSAVSPTLVSAMRTLSTLPPFRRNTTAAAAVAQSPVLRLSFSYA